MFDNYVTRIYVIHKQWVQIFRSAVAKSQFYLSCSRLWHIMKTRLFFLLLVRLIYLVSPSLFLSQAGIVVNSLLFGMSEELIYYYCYSGSALTTIHSVLNNIIKIEFYRWCFSANLAGWIAVKHIAINVVSLGFDYRVKSHTVQRIATAATFFK